MGSRVGLKIMKNETKNLRLSSLRQTWQLLYFLLHRRKTKKTLYAVVYAHVKHANKSTCYKNVHIHLNL